MSSSILQKHKECYVTGTTYGLHLHHVYGGPNRKVSDRMGFIVWLDARIHMALHEHRPPFQNLMYELRGACQCEFEKTHTHEEFMNLIGRDYSEWF